MAAFVLLNEKHSIGMHLINLSPDKLISSLLIRDKTFFTHAARGTSERTRLNIFLVHPLMYMAIRAHLPILKLSGQC